jgi:hypothetical protein
MEGGDVAGGGSEPSLAFTCFEPEVLKEERFGKDVLGSGGGVEEGEGLARGVWGLGRTKFTVAVASET